ELPHPPVLHRATQWRRHRLHAVTNAKYGHPSLPRRVRRARRIAFGHALGSARQDDSGGRKVADERVADIVGMDLAIHVQLAHAARDELRVLGAEIEDQDLAMHVRVSGRARDALKCKMASCHDERDGLEGGAYEEGSADLPV